MADQRRYQRAKEGRECDFHRRFSAALLLLHSLIDSDGEGDVDMADLVAMGPKFLR